MDYKLFASTFAAIFLAELGDKTQLATLTLASGPASRWTVFFGSALALVATSAIAVLGGEAVSRVVDPVWLKRAAGTLFVVLGLWTLWGSRPGAPHDADGNPSAAPATTSAPPAYPATPPPPPHAPP